jgi:hypothetical protein
MPGVMSLSTSWMKQAPGIRDVDAIDYLTASRSQQASMSRTWCCSSLVVPIEGSADLATSVLD